MVPISKSYSFCFFLCIITGISSKAVNGEKEEGGAACLAYITVSSFWFIPAGNEGLRSGLKSRQIELNWTPLTCAHVHSVVLLSENPEFTNRSLNESLVMASAPAGEYPEGSFRTNVSLGRPRLPGGWDRSDLPQDTADTTEHHPTQGDQCLNFWVALFNLDGSLVASDCLKIRPTWMWDHRARLAEARLDDLVIPGTHNSGSFYRGDALATGDTMSRFVLTQDEGVWEQLVWGARYLDLRVGYSTKDKAGARLWVYHGPVRVMPLQPLLQDVRRFLRHSPGEVVVLDLHRFPDGFSTTWQRGRDLVRHRRLASMLKNELGSFAAKCTPDGSPKLEDLWRDDHRLVVHHAERKKVQTTWPANWICGPLPQAWGNRQTTQELKAYLQEAMVTHSRTPGLWAAMAELTPLPLDPIIHPTRGLRMMADEVNRNVTQWFRDLWWGDANIVATDFMLGNNMVAVAIEANLKRFPPK